MRILILGAGGMLGHKLWHYLDGLFETYATVRSPSKHFDILGLNTNNLLNQVDALNIDSVIKVMGQVQPDVVINCVGIVKQLSAAKELSPCLTINALFPHRLASLCQATRTRLIHISTDCVFSGKRGNYLESDIPDPEDLYGRTKLLGEIQGDGIITIRTSIIGRELNSNISLVDWFLAQQGKVYGYKNAIYNGLTTNELARTIGTIIKDFPDLHGLFQISSDTINKFELLKLVQEKFKKRIELVSVEEPRINRSLNCSRFIKATGYTSPCWEEMIAEMASEASIYEKLARL